MGRVVARKPTEESSAAASPCTAQPSPLGGALRPATAELGEDRAAHHPASASVEATSAHGAPRRKRPPGGRHLGVVAFALLVNPAKPRNAARELAKESVAA